MYAQTELFFPYLQNFGQDMQQIDEYCKSQKPNVSMSNLVQTTSISDYDLGGSLSDYDLGGEGDLFKAPEPIIEETGLALDPMTAAMSIVSCGEDVITSQGLEAAAIESFQNEQLFREVLLECEKDLMATVAMDTPLSNVMDIKIAAVKTDQIQNQENKVIHNESVQKSVSSCSLSAMDWVQGAAVKPNYLEFPMMDFSEYGMRRAYSEGDIKTLSNGNMSLIHSPHERPLVISGCSSEDRREKLSRYRNKKAKRNFGRKIKYACRKALADSQPRVRGRFAKTEESDTSKGQ